jgi:hypothetical protein
VIRPAGPPRTYLKIAICCSMLQSSRISFSGKKLLNVRTVRFRGFFPCDLTRELFATLRDEINFEIGSKNFSPEKTD